MPAAAGEAVLQKYRMAGCGSAADRAEEYVHSWRDIADTTSAHLALVEQCVDVARIRSNSFHVLLDANHGSGSVLGRPLLEHLGCRGDCVGRPTDGLFAHPPEPTAENLSTVLANVTQCGADIGFCQDPDADRLAIIDENGRYIGEEYTLAICVDHVLRATPGPVVTNCSTSRMTEDLANKYGVPFHRSAVGEANVVDAMLRHGGRDRRRRKWRRNRSARGFGSRQLCRDGARARCDGKARPNDQ